LLLAQGVQAVGSVLSGVLANGVFLRRGARGMAPASVLVDVQWTYLAVTLLTVVLAVVFYYVPLPEVRDGELADMASRLVADPKRRWVGGVSLRTWAIALAVLAQWCYASAQENMSLFVQQLTTAFVSGPSGPSRPNGYRPASLALSLPNYLLVAHSVFALARFLASGLCYLSARFPSSFFLPTARALLSAAVFSSTMCVLTVVVLPTTTNPNLAVIPIILFFFSEGPIWPLVFSLGLRGQGDRTKRAAVWITMGGCGPAVWPFVSYGIIQAGGSVQVAMVVVVVLMAMVGVYPLFLTVVKRAREMVDIPPGEVAASQRKGSDGSEGSSGSGGGVVM
jgi:fucose permease